MAELSGHELLQLFDCAVPGCQGEAEVEDGLCQRCTKAARERAREGAPCAGKLETGMLALVGLARELDAELHLWHAQVAQVRKQLPARRR